ncbi:MAG: hypothetical protein J6Q54_07745 [Oscillospiraceae bacterium]|nr:hypothetical protein [Oscillospiraceae bacterium]
MRIFLAILCSLVLMGCATQETFEMVGDENVLIAGTPAEIQLSLPENTVAMTGVDGTNEMYYHCDGFDIHVQTMDGGAIEQTIRKITGFEPTQLTIVRTDTESFSKYSFVWSTSGETECQVCRGMILDDGSHHYAVSVMADYTQAGGLAEQWNTLFSSVTISTD